MKDDSSIAPPGAPGGLGVLQPGPPGNLLLSAVLDELEAGGELMREAVRDSLEAITA